MADGRGPPGQGRGSWLLGRATLGGAVSGAITAAIGIGPVGVAEGFASGESTSHALSELKLAMAAPVFVLPGAAIGLAVGILVGVFIALVVPHVRARLAAATTVAITAGVIIAVAVAVGVTSLHYEHSAVNGYATFIAWGVIPAVIALPLAVIAARRLARSYLAQDFTPSLPAEAATDPSASSRVFSAVFGMSLGLGAIFGAIAAMLGGGPVLAMYAAAGTHNWPWRDFAASIMTGLVFAFYAAPIGMMVGLLVGLVCGVVLGRYVVRARRSRAPIDVVRRFRPVIAITLIAVAGVTAPLTTSQRGAHHDLLRTTLAFSGIPLLLALTLAMIGASWVQRAYIREEARPLPAQTAWLTSERLVSQ
jgi:hypothetical protein